MEDFKIYAKDLKVFYQHDDNSKTYGSHKLAVIDDRTQSKIAILGGGEGGGKRVERCDRISLEEGCVVSGEGEEEILLGRYRQISAHDLFKAETRDEYHLTNDDYAIEFGCLSDALKKSNAGDLIESISKKIDNGGSETLDLREILFLKSRIETIDQIRHKAYLKFLNENKKITQQKDQRKSSIKSSYDKLFSLS